MERFYSKPFFWPRFSRRKAWNCTSGSVQNRARWRPGNSGAVTSKAENFCCFGVNLTNLKFSKDLCFIDAKTQEAMRDVVRIYKNLHDRQSGVWLFSRSISPRWTVLRLDLLTVRNQMFFYGNSATLHCSTQKATFNSNVLEHIAKFWFLFCRINRGKTTTE